jgi:hypothetical protein
MRLFKRKRKEEITEVDREILKGRLEDMTKADWDIHFYALRLSFLLIPLYNLVSDIERLIVKSDIIDPQRVIEKARELIAKCESYQDTRDSLDKARKEKKNEEER